MFRSQFIAGAGVLITALCPSVLQAQALEEIVVTAQRRVQSLQEVPISIYAVTGAELERQGYRDINQFAVFSPTVWVDEGNVIGPALAIRGFGTTGNSVTVDSSVPIFLDGIHLARNSMMKTAFLDLDSLEVLKGPQPIYFGQNAIAGAINIQSRKPTPEWVGNLDIEYGNNRTQELAAGIGGPINDRWRMRVAGKYEDSAGFMTDIMTGNKFPAYYNLGGRLSLQWLPTDSLTVNTKVEATKIRKDVESPSICRTPGKLIYGRDDPTEPGTMGNERAIWGTPPRAEVFSTPFAVPLTADCENTDVGISAGGPYLQPPDNIREENSNFGSVDIRAAADGLAKLLGNEGVAGYENLDMWSSYLDANYTLDSGISAAWTTGYVRYDREYVRDNSRTPFLLNFQGRNEDYHQWSSELRLSSPSGGMFEWYVGGFYQLGELDSFSSSIRGNVRRGQRYNTVFEDQETYTAFGNITFNFLDDKASIDLGGRYTKNKKHTGIIGIGGTWIYDVTPCDPDAVTQDPGPSDAEIAACIAAADPNDPSTLHSNALQVPLDQAQIFVEGADTSNLWTLGYDAGGDAREVPPNWLPSRARAVGLTAPSFYPQSTDFDNLGSGLRGGPFDEHFNPSEFDPQVVLRYRFADNLSTYAKWAQSFKNGGFDTGQTSISDTLEDYAFEPEYAETYEIGAKGTYMDGRGRYDATLFTLEFKNLQVSVATSDVDDPFININAGSQRVRGLEFSNQFAVNERLRLGIAGAILDGEFTNFPNSSCTIEESRVADTGPCLTVEESIAQFGHDEAADTIDRTGQATPRTPDWKFIFDVGYWRPVLTDKKVNFIAKAYYSDGYITDFEGFSEISSYKKHGDINLNITLGDMDDTWGIGLWVRNLLEARSSFDEELHINSNGDGSFSQTLSPTSFTTYGLKLTYNFR